jgi:hypothetical protein
MTAQRNKAKKVGGTTTLFIRNKMRSLEIGISANPVWINQYRITQSKPAATSRLVADRQSLRVTKLTVNSSIPRQVVRKVDEARPDCFQASLEKVASLDRKYRRPHQCDKR